MEHPGTLKSSIFGPGHSVGPLWHLVSRRGKEEASARGNVFSHILSNRSVKTGARSVCDRYLGRTESPLGDATLLPVLSLKDLDQMGSQVSGWVGYTPIHCGFQYLQEKFDQGLWAGENPLFKQPKAFRRAEHQSAPIRSRRKRPTSNPGHSFRTGNSNFSRPSDIEQIE